jgi:hypothetical protein
MREIEVRDIKEQSCDLFNPAGVFLGTITNEVQLTDVRTQIKKRGVLGYYIMFNDGRHDINHDGRFIEGYPDGLFPTLSELLWGLI